MLPVLMKAVPTNTNRFLKFAAHTVVNELK